MDSLIYWRHLHIDILLLDALCDITGHLKTLRPRRSAFDNTLLFTIDAIHEELDAVSRQHASHNREMELLRDLKVVVGLLEKLSDTGLHRRPCHQSKGPS